VHQNVSTLAYKHRISRKIGIPRAAGREKRRGYKGKGKEV